MIVLDYDIQFSETASDREREYVLIALLTRKRARPEDAAPDVGDRGGWWGDNFSDYPGWEIGSLLWTLENKTVAEVVALAPGFMREALACGIEDGLWSAVECTCERIDGQAVAKVRTISASGQSNTLIESLVLS